MVHSAKQLFQQYRSYGKLLVQCVCVGFLLWSIAYQAPFSRRLFIGGNTQTHRREFDAPFLSGFNASEPENPDDYRWWTLSPGYAYRWATNHATITLPGIGGNRWVVSFAAVSGRADGSAVTSQWQSGNSNHTNDDMPMPITIAAIPRTYHILATTTHDGSLMLTMDTPLYDAPNDVRTLGFVLCGVRVAPLHAIWHAPALATLGWLGIILVLLAMLSRFAGLSDSQSVAIFTPYFLLTSWLIVAYRLGMALVLPRLVLVLGSAILFAWGAVWFTRWFAQPTITNRKQTNAIAALIVVAYTLRVVGMLHPHAIFSDHRMHANNLLQVGVGTLYFTEGLPQEAGGGQSPYPPGSYLMIAPLLLAVPGTMAHRVMAVQSGMAFLDSLVLLLLWYVLRCGGSGQRAALWGAALYVLPPPMMTSFSIGEYANIGGQAMALPIVVWFACIATKHTWQTIQRLSMGILLLSMGWLSHMGVTISLTLLLVAWGGVLMSILTTAYARGDSFSAAMTRRMLLRLLLVGSVAGVVVLLCYYSAPQFVTLFAERFTSTTAISASLDAAPSHQTPIATLVQLVTGLVAPQSMLLPILLVIAIAGTLLALHKYIHAVYRHRSVEVRQRVVWLIVAWWSGTILSWGLFVVAHQGVRWQHFLYPALCVASGFAIAHVLQRGRAGILVVASGVGLVVLHGLVVWVEHLWLYLH